MSRLDDLQIARCEVVENAAILRGRIRDLNVQLKSTLPYSEYTRAADEWGLDERSGAEGGE